VIAHAGGWDELLMGVLPVLVFLVVYRAIRGRASEPEPKPRQEARR
jgi:hypothetical protein